MIIPYHKSCTSLSLALKVHLPTRSHLPHDYYFADGAGIRVLLLRIILGYCGNLFGLFFERVFRHRVEAENGLVGVLDQNVLAFVHLHAHVDDGADDTPSVVEVERHLRGEVTRLVGEDAEDDVVVVVLGVGAGDESRWTLVAIME